MATSLHQRWKLSLLIATIVPSKVGEFFKTYSILLMNLAVLLYVFSIFFLFTLKFTIQLK